MERIGKFRYAVFVAILLLMSVVVMPLHAYSRVALGASWGGIDMKGMLVDSDAMHRESMMGPFLVFEGEYVPVTGLSLFARASVDPFGYPMVKVDGNSSDIIENTFDPYFMAGSFGLGIGWQMPFSEWARRDIPVDFTLGLGASVNMFHLKYDTPALSSVATQIDIGAGLLCSLSVYFNEYIGLTLSSMPTVGFYNWTVRDVGYTGLGSSRSTLFFGTSLEYSWDAALLMTIRFGY